MAKGNVNSKRIDLIKVTDELKAKLIAYRKKHILTQREMAKLLSYSASAYNRLESGVASHLNVEHKKAIDKLLAEDKIIETVKEEVKEIDKVDDGVICFNSEEKADVEEIHPRAKQLLKIECVLNNCTEEEFIMKHISENTKKVLNILNK